MTFSLFGNIFVIVREAVFGEDDVLELCGGTYSELW